MISNNEYSNDGTSLNRPVSSIGVASEPILSPLSSEINVPCNYNANQDPNVERIVVNGKQRWKCVFCKMSFAWNATKVIKHFAGITQGDIKCCGAIPTIQKIEYGKIYESKEQTMKKYNQQVEMHRELMEANNNEVAAMFEKGKRKKSSVPVIEPSTKAFYQTKIDGEDPTSESQLSAAIAAFIHCCGLPFSVVDHPTFVTVLRLAKRVGNNYIPPDRKKISGVLLDMTYEQMQKQQQERLLLQVETFGLSLYGDGATIHKMPLLNLLASGVHANVAVLDIVDATEHIRQGGKKDAKYISSLFEPHIRKFQAESANCVDYLSFDGAGNVQLAGRILAAKFPRIICTHGAEHVISLFFQDCFKLPLLNTLHKLERKIYAIFGSGARHSPYAVFQGNCKKLYGNEIGLFRPSGTRMAGNAIALMRSYRLRDAMKATIHSAEFLSCKVRILYSKYI